MCRPCSRAQTAGPSCASTAFGGGDSLWTIAREHGITVGELRDVNGIQGSRIFVGQLIDVPQGG